MGGTTTATLQQEADGRDHPSIGTCIPSDKLSTNLVTVDDLVRKRAKELGSRPIVSYPSTGTEYVDYTVRELDVFAWRTAQHYMPQLRLRKSAHDRSMVVALLGPSNLEYLVTMLSLVKMGHTVLFLSTRITSEAIAALMKTTHATSIIFDPRYADTAKLAASTFTFGDSSGVLCLEIAPRAVFEAGLGDLPVDFDTQMVSTLDTKEEGDRHVYIIHSSGSTGFPKPIYQTQRAALVNFSRSMEMRAFITLPLYHNHGICNLFRAIYCGQSIHLYNADLPLTAGHLESILSSHHFEIFYGVPYALKLLAETPTGIALLRQLKVVMYGGSACPDELGDLLTKAGVNVIGHYGATEVGQLMTSARPKNDTYWNYVREPESLSPFLNWIPRGPNLFECCVLDGWPTKLTSNMPDGSYATKDLFEPHPTLPRAWKYVARLDDTIALVNGEKFSPVPLEGCVRSDPWVTEAVVFGSGRPYTGLLLVPSPLTAGKSRDEIIDHIWPIVREASSRYEAYGQVSRNMICVLPLGVAYPSTDKGSIIRQAFYRDFATEIDQAYEDAESHGAATAKTMSLDETRSFLRQKLVQILGEKAGTVPDSTDFFSLGMDSLQSIQLRQEIVRGVNIGNSRLGSNVVFDYPSIDKLARFLDTCKTGAAQPGGETRVEDHMQSLIDKLSTFDGVLPSSRRSVVLTGATGSLGAHVLAKLAANEAIHTIYCLARAADYKDAQNRVFRSLHARRVLHSLTLEQRRKLQCLPFDQSDNLLGLGPQVYQEVSGSGVRAIIHCAWSVNFNLNLSSFEDDCLAGLHNLLILCHACTVGATHRPVFSFCSSVSSVAHSPESHIPESLPELTSAQDMGYAQSKCVAEHVCVRASKTLGISARVLRIGQVIADTRFGIWNTTEAIPLMLQSALTIGALPKLKENPSWLPVDIVAQAISDASLADDDQDALVMNIANKQSFSWTEDLLPALHTAGLVFDEVEPREWVDRLRNSNPDPVANPPIKLVNFFASKYDRDDWRPSKTYATDVACRLSPALAAAPVLDSRVVERFISQFKHKWAVNSRPKKTAIVVAGPCGSGKSTIAARISKELGAHFIEGDDLHPSEAISQTVRGSTLTDDDLSAWLGRVRQRICQTLGYGADCLDYDTTVVACSALRRAHRSVLRNLQADVTTVFLDLQASSSVLQGRVSSRENHSMLANLATEQERIHEPIADEEADVIPLDAEAGVDVVVSSALLLLGDVV